MPLDIFDPQLYARARLPADAAGALSLPPWCYTRPEYFRREVERIFLRSWNFIGRVERVAQPGDYVAFSYAGVPVILTRDRQGRLRAFANACRHRGARLLPEGEGHCRAIQCPYHAWTYDLDGTLTGAPEMGETPGFAMGDYPLIPLRLETWAGFAFINFDAAAPPLATQLGDLPARLAPYRLEEMRPTFRRQYDLACNWKLAVENFLEYYHTPYLHRRSVYQTPVGFLGQERRTGMVRLPAETGSGEHVFFFMRHEGSRAVLHGDPSFPPMAHLEGRLARGTYSGCVLPCAMWSCHADCMWFLEIYPQAHDRTRIFQVGCFPESAIARPDFAEIAQSYYKRWDTVMGEDAAFLPIQQIGLDSPFTEAGPVCHVEDKIHLIRRRWLDRMIGDGADGASAAAP